MAAAWVGVMFWLDSKLASSEGSLGLNLIFFFNGLYKEHWVGTPLDSVLHLKFRRVELRL